MPVAFAAPPLVAACPDCLGGGTGGTVTSLGALTDVTLTGPLTAGMVLKFNGTQWVDAELFVDDLGDADTTTTAPAIGETLVWDGTNFVPGAAAGAANPTVHLTDTAVAPATAGEPTLAEITAAAGANRDVFLEYTGTDTATDPVLRSYYIDSAGAVTLVEEPNVATCALREIGGVGGTLAAGLGAGVPNPTLDGYTLAADRMVGIVTTAPTGGPDTFEVRLMPVNTVITTGTIADGATAATFTPYADLALASGQWFEVVVTTVSAGTPSAELTVAAELCGPGTPTTVTAGGTDIDSFTFVQAVASTTWTAVHNLGRPVAVRIEDGAGNDVAPDDIDYPDNNTVVVTFLAPQAGTLYAT